MICCRQSQADNGSQEEEGENEVINGSDPGVSACKVLLDIPFAEQKDDSWYQVGIYVSRLVVKIGPTVERNLSRA